MSARSPTDLIPDDGNAERFVKRACVREAYPALTAVQTSAQQSSLDGYIATIGTDLMAASAPSRPSPASHWAPMAELAISPSK
jgi:hypothetical protein